VQQPNGAPAATTFTATSDSDKNAKVAQLQQHAPVESVQPQTTLTTQDATISPPTNDLCYSHQWGLSGGPTPGADFPPAWAAAFTGQGERIAMIDTGIRLTHDSLSPNVVAGPDFVTNANGSVNVSASLAGNGDPNGHGTHTAGIAGAANNGSTTGDTSATIGGAPGAKLLAVRVLDQTGSGSDANVANAITWAATPTNQTFQLTPSDPAIAGGGANVISLSLGGSANVPALQTAVEFAKQEGVVVVAAAGNNNGAPPGSACDSTAVDYPAGYSTDPKAAVIAVAATDNTGAATYYSYCGSYVDIAAPGGTGSSTSTSILSSANSSDTATRLLNGTSMAAPLVSAAAALLLEKCPGTDPVKVSQDLVSKGPAVTGQSFNRLDAGAAVTGLCPP
jgi:subtilisin family serine protease